MGAATEALALAFDEVRSRGGKEVYTSWVPGEASPEPFYLGLGFEPTGQVDGEEIVARLHLADARCVARRSISLQSHSHRPGSPAQAPSRTLSVSGARSFPLMTVMTAPSTSSDGQLSRAHLMWARGP
jgi:hypothetical protein